MFALSICLVCLLHSVDLTAQRFWICFYTVSDCIWNSYITLCWCTTFKKKKKKRICQKIGFEALNVFPVIPTKEHRINLIFFHPVSVLTFCIVTLKAEMQKGLTHGYHAVQNNTKNSVSQLMKPKIHDKKEIEVFNFLLDPKSLF